MDCSVQASLSFIIPRSLLKFMSIELVLLSNSPFSENAGLISFRIYWFALQVQGTLKSITRLWYSVNIIFKQTWKPKTMWLTLLQYLLYCGGLETAPRHLQGVPVLTDLQDYLDLSWVLLVNPNLYHIFW